MSRKQLAITPTPSNLPVMGSYYKLHLSFIALLPLQFHIYVFDPLVNDFLLTRL